MAFFWHIETGALRLAAFGLGVMITYLLMLRVIDWRSGRILRPGERAVQGLDPATTCVVSALLSVVILSTTAGSIIGRFPDWITDPGPVPLRILHVPIVVIATILIDRIAYYPAMKHKWCFGWIVLAHVVQWGGYLVMTR